MPYFVDRRLNPKHKSHGNRQRFLKRARAHIKTVVDRAVRDRKIGDVGDGEVITIPTRGIEEPRFHGDGKAGTRHRVLPGNRDFIPGDHIKKPPGGNGVGAGGEGDEEGGGEDGFQFVLSRDEFLEMFFEDLELPDLVKTDLTEITLSKPRRAGFTKNGSAANLNLVRTMRNSVGRRRALKRPGRRQLADLEAQIAVLWQKHSAPGIPATVEGETAAMEIAALREELGALEKRRRVVGFIDPMDVRYNNFEPVPEPNTKAVMFCLMDVSGSMGDREKDLAKRFFILLHLFLSRRYERTELVFIRHTHRAEEVDEETFFYDRQNGGTVVSTALTKMLEVLNDRFPPSEWNIYAAQASDGENFSGDDARCADLLPNQIMPLVQYYAYVEIVGEMEFEFAGGSSSGAALWRSYQDIDAAWKNFTMKRIAYPGDIFPVFRELFQKQTGEA